MRELEWSSTYSKEPQYTKRGDEIMRVSKNGNIRIIYRRFAVQGKYSIERKTIYGNWDNFYMARYSSDFISEVERNCKYITDEPLDPELLSVE